MVSDGFFCFVVLLFFCASFVHLSCIFLVDSYDNDMTTIRQLISRGVDVNVCDYDGRRYSEHGGGCSFRSFRSSRSFVLILTTLLLLVLLYQCPSSRRLRKPRPFAPVLVARGGRNRRRSFWQHPYHGQCIGKTAIFYAVCKTAVICAVYKAAIFCAVCVCTPPHCAPSSAPSNMDRIGRSGRRPSPPRKPPTAPWFHHRPALLGVCFQWHFIRRFTLGLLLFSSAAPPHTASTSPFHHHHHACLGTLSADARVARVWVVVVEVVFVAAVNVAPITVAPITVASATVAWV